MDYEINPEAVARLTRYQRALLERFRPLLDRVDAAKLASESIVVLDEHRHELRLRIHIEPRDGVVPGLQLLATPGQCILSAAEAELVECHGDPDEDDGLVDQVCNMAARYLAGTTVLHHYNKHERLVRSDYYFGIDTENDPACRIGSSRWPLVIPRAIWRTDKQTFTFFE